MRDRLPSRASVGLAAGLLLAAGSAALSGTSSVGRNAPDEVAIVRGPGPTWIDMNENLNYTARHECSFVQAADRFYLFGGRENARTLDTYDYAANTWSTSAMAPIEFNHFQATEHQGLIWVIGAFKTNSFPNESPADFVYVLDPARNVWMTGPQIPVPRRRGSTGLVVHEGKFYVVAGNTIGHNGGYVAWFDVYDPQSGVWTPLADAPGPRDHFHAARVGDRLYAVGGRLSGGPGGTFAPLIPEVDVYDFTTASWTRLAPASNLPTPRAAAAVAFFGGEILVAGGEGNGQAYATVEGFDPLTGGWTARASLNHARHGTQAIVSGQGVYVTAGSPNQGGGNQRNMEVYDADQPAGSPALAGILAAPAEVNVPSAAHATVRLSHAGGNQGVFVNQVTLSGPAAADFAVTSDVSRPFLIPIAGFRDLLVEYNGVAEGAAASLTVTHGGSVVLTVALTGTLAAGAPGRVGSLLVGKSGANLELSWSADCGAAGAYGVYRGDLALGYGSLAIAACDLPGTGTAIPIGPAAGEFFLVVPSLGTAEGSFGHAAACAERPPPPSVCHPRDQLDPCAVACGG